MDWNGISKKLGNVANGTRIIDGDPEPKWIGFDETFSISGIDSDSDNLRDDVEIYINVYFDTTNRRKAAKEYSKMYILNMVKYNKNVSTKKEISEWQIFSRSFLDRSLCFGSFYRPMKNLYGGPEDQLTEILANTKLRLLMNYLAKQNYVYSDLIIKSKTYKRVLCNFDWQKTWSKKDEM